MGRPGQPTQRRMAIRQVSHPKTIVVAWRWRYELALTLVLAAAAFGIVPALGALRLVAGHLTRPA
jgi:hypothetical protein